MLEARGFHPPRFLSRWRSGGGAGGGAESPASEQLPASLVRRGMLPVLRLPETTFVTVDYAAHDSGCPRSTTAQVAGKEEGFSIPAEETDPLLGFPSPANTEASQHTTGYRGLFKWRGMNPGG